MEVAAKTPLSKKACEDYELVKLAVKGNQRAYTQLMGRYECAIFALMYKMVGNKEDANDLKVEAFGKAFQKLANYTPHYAFSTWLFKVAVNNCIDHVRKNRIPICSIDDSTDPEGYNTFSAMIGGDELNPEEEIIRQQRISLMRHVLSGLGDKYRLMIEMRYYEEKTYDEIAVELGIPIGTVKAQLHRAKELLYEQLQRPGASAYLEMTRRRSVAV